MSNSIPRTTIVNVTNLSSTDTYVFQWENETWRVPPGKTVVAPYFGMCYWFGDPRAVNVGDPDANQETQYRTLQQRAVSVRYGVYDNPWFSEGPFTAMDDSDHREHTNKVYVQRDGKFVHPHLPWVVVTDMDGNRLFTVLDDPLGEQLPTSEGTARAEAKATTAALAALQQQMSQLQLQLAKANSEFKADPDFEGEVGAKVDEAQIGPSAPAAYDHVNTDEIPADDAIKARPTLPPPPPPKRASELA